MPKVRARRLRPTPSIAVALLALFIALGGPAQAKRLIDGKSIRKGTITGRQIKDHALGQGELTKATVQALRATPANSVGPNQIADGAVTAPKLAAGAVTGGALAAGSVGSGQLAQGAVTASKIGPDAIGGANIANGSLQTVDVGTFAGALQVDFMPFAAYSCQVAPTAATPTGGGAPNIGDDVVIASPEAGFPDQLVVSANPGAGNVVRLVVCNPTGDTSIDPGPTVFRYVSFDSP
jgi:hypothetical protein